MRKFTLDFLFDEITGESKILIDYNDSSLTVWELNQAVKDGEIREEIYSLAGKIFGEEIESQIRSGKLPVVCLDDHPEEKESIINNSLNKEVHDLKKDNLI